MAFFGMNQFPAAPGQTVTGGLGGLGGNPMLQAIGLSLMSSPRNNPLQGFGDAYAGLQKMQMYRQEQARDEAKELRSIADRRSSMNSTKQWLLSKGYSEEDAAAAVANPAILSSIMKEMAGGERQGLINAGDGMIYDPNSKEWITAPGTQGTGGPFRFGGNSVEAQALNGLMDSGQLTVDQAQQLAAGKTITGPNGEIIFMTPQGVFSRPSTDGGSQPDAGGNIQVTGPKAPDVNERAAGGFADRLNNSGVLIDELENAGTDRWDQVKSMVPVIGNDLVSEDYQKLDQAKRDFVNAVLRRESGAVISQEEFDNANRQYFPQPGDTPATIKQKARNRALVIESMTRDAGPTYKRSGAKAAGKTSGGVQWSIEP